MAVVKGATIALRPILVKCADRECRRTATRALLLQRKDTRWSEKTCPTHTRERRTDETITVLSSKRLTTH